MLLQRNLLFIVSHASALINNFATRVRVYCL